MTDASSDSAGSWLTHLFRWLGLGGSEPRQSRGQRTSGAIFMELEAGSGPSWGTLSGLTAHPTDAARLYAVTDQDSPPARIVEIAVSGGSARVDRQITISGEDLDGLDCEAVAALADGGFWLASEGGEEDAPQNRLVEVDAQGRAKRVLALPRDISALIEEKGFEGVAIAQVAGARRLFVAFQKPLSDGPRDKAPVAMVDPASATWRFALYPLERLDKGGLTGLSEIVHVGGDQFAVIERDGKAGKSAIKWVTSFRFPVDAATTNLADAPVLAKRLVVDLVPLFRDADRKVEREIEGLTISADGRVFLITDNDGEHPTLLIELVGGSGLFDA